MRYIKLILGVLTGVFFLGILNGCNHDSADFHSSEEAQKYVLAKLKDKYKEKFCDYRSNDLQRGKNRLELDDCRSIQ